MYVNYNIEKSKQHSTTTKYTAKNKNSKQQDHTRIWALALCLTDPFPSCQHHSSHSPRSGGFSQLGASRIWIWPTLAGDLFLDTLPFPAP